MELLAILLALGVFGVRGDGGAIQSDGWFGGFRAWLSRGVNGRALQLGCVLLPAALVSLIYAKVDDAIFGLVGLVFLLLVLVYSFGRGNLGALYAGYLERWSRGDFQAAWRVIGEPDGDEAESIRQPAELHAVARRGYYARAFERNFAVLFWFVLLGPGGAMAYRLAALENATTQGGVAAGPRLALLHWMDWLPVRLVSICFALVGDFDACLYRWQALLTDGQTATADALEACGNAAQRIPTESPAGETTEQLIARGAAEIDAVEVMHRRAMLVWLVVIALLVMIG